MGFLFELWLNILVPELSFSKTYALSRIWRVELFGIGVKRMMYERIVVPTVIYGAEAWCLKEGEKRRLNVFEIKCLFY